MNTENTHLVAVDAGAPDARVVICMPPKEPLSVDAAISLAAHLVAKTNAALFEKGAPISTPRQLFDKIDAIKNGKSASRADIRKDPSGRIAIPAVQFFRADEALKFAAELVAVADPDANMLVHVSEVVAAAAGGKALERELSDPRSAQINLSSPRRATRIVDMSSAESTTPPPLEVEELDGTSTDGEVEVRRIMKGGRRDA